MSAAGRRLGLALLALSLLSGCDGIVEVCRACLKGDPTRPVAVADLPRIRLVRGNLPLPSGASAVYYRELCGIDCVQWVRFDVDRASGEAFVQKLVGRPPVPTPAGPETPGDDAAVRRWWPAHWPAGTRVAEVDDDPRPAMVAILVRGNRARLWVRANET